MLATAPRPLPTDLRQLASHRPESPVLFVQATYYLLIGLGPVLAASGLRALAGSDDLGLLRGFGVVVAAVGAVLMFAARRRELSPETARLGVTVAVVLAVADVTFVLKGSVPPLYLLDAGVQVAFVLWWGRALFPREPQLVGRVPAALA